MGTTGLSRPSSLRTESIPPSVGDSVRKPFNFLGLPLDIRLMIYEELRMKTYRDKIPIRNTGDHLTLVTTVIPGISILATCRQVRAEASVIILPWLQKILNSQPTISIRAEHIISLINMQYCYTPFCFKSIMERLIFHIRSRLAGFRIMQYRRQKLAANQLWKKFLLHKCLAAEDDASLNAYVRFVLRAKAYIASRPDTEYTYPPLSLVLEVPDTFLTMTVTTSTSKMMSFTFKAFSPLVRTPQQTVTSQADLTWLVSQFTGRMAASCQRQRVVSLVVKLRYVVVGRTGWGVSGRVIQNAIMMGLQNAKVEEPYLVRFGGKVTNKIREEV